jgi:hypothetical protein
MNKSRFLFIDADAAEDISSTRTLQSEEFEQGKLLGSTLLGELSPHKISSHTYVIKTNSGMYFLSDKENQSDLLVIDLEGAPLFESCSTRDALGRFLKLLRFSRRRWSQVSPSHNERLIPGSSKAVVFPYPITTKSSFRISLELAPDKHRRVRRASGMEMLAYRIGTDEGGGPQEEAPVTNFRKALEELQDAVSQLKSQIESSTKSQLSEPLIDSLSITRLQGSSVNGGIAGCNFDEWSHYLTASQKAFIERELTGPHRIEGPAGTGKTLCLVLKCIFQLRRAKLAGKEHRALFVAHSVATRKSIEDMFAPELLGQSLSTFDLQSVKITTLHELCGELLRYEISDSELLDRDAFESKQSQLLYSVEALQEALDADLQSHQAHMSPGFVSFLKSNDEWNVAEMIQHEISVVIKGRANEDLEKYKRLPKLKYGLPIENAGDKAFTYLIFKAYQRRLQTSGQFDTDDVVLSALRSLDTPIWRRRREKEGFDSIYIDETHLFNINELSAFHQLTRTADHFPIAYSADVSQSLGDRGWSDVSFNDALLGDGEAAAHEQSQQTIFRSIFRCSPEIVNLAFSVTSSGATLFTNFHDPLEAASSAFTEDEERKCLPPQYLFYPNDELMIAAAFSLAENFASEMGTTRAGVAIVVFGTELFSQVEKVARSSNKPVELLKHRGDMEVVRHARSSGRFILTTPDFVGGLEFDAVILVGVDKGRVPPVFSHDSSDSENFVSYATHQRLYVAITRARYRVAILGDKARGVSDVLANAVTHNILQVG